MMAKGERGSASESNPTDHVWSDVVVIAGGITGEREVSLKSGHSCAQGLQRARHRVTFYDFNGDPSPFIALLATLPRNVVVFNALHGGFGEDGRLQALLDQLGVRYTHAGSRAAALGMDKPVTKALAAREGLPVAAHSVVPLDVAKEMLRSRRLPFDRCIMKPAQGGSSVGIVAILNDQDVENAPHMAAHLMSEDQGSVLVERFIQGRELTVGVLDGEALGVTEIVHNAGFYTYDQKYKTGTQTHCCPADVPPVVAATACDYAERLYRVIGCRGVARVDMIWSDHLCDASISSKPTASQAHSSHPIPSITVLEINVCPGMTEVSLVPEQAAARGMSFELLLRRMLATARYDLV